MATLPTAESLNSRVPQGASRIATTTVQSADRGDDTIGVTADAMQRAGMQLAEIGLQQQNRARRLNLMKAKSRLAVGLVQAEDESTNTPYGERLGVFQKSSDKAYEEAAKLLGGDAEGLAEFQAHAMPSIANYGSRVSMSALKDERTAAVADYKEAALQATQELGRTEVGDVASNTVIIDRMAERIQTLVEMQAITPEQAQQESAVLRETYAKVQFGKLDARGQLEAVKKARSKEHRGWESFLPAQQLDAMKDAAEAELKVEDTKRGGQAKFDEVYAKYRGNSAAQIRDIRADKSLTPEQRDDAIARVDRQATRDRQAKATYEESISTRARQFMAQGGRIEDFPARDFLRLPLKEQMFLQEIQDKRDKRQRDLVARGEEERDKANRSVELGAFEEFKRLVAGGEWAKVADYTFNNIEARFPADKVAEAQRDVETAVQMLRKHDVESVQRAKDAQFTESTLNDRLEKAYLDLGFTGKGSVAEGRRLELKLAVREELDKKRKELRGKDAVLTASDVNDVVTTMTRTYAIERPGLIFGTNTTHVPSYQLDELTDIPPADLEKVLAEWPEVLRQKGQAERQPTTAEVIRLFKMMHDAGTL